MINIEDFKKIDLRVGKVISAEKVLASEKLLKLTVDLGESKVMEDGQVKTYHRQILSGIAKFYNPEELISKNVVIVSNLEPRIIMGTESKGMVLAITDKDGSVVVIGPEREVSPGSRIS